MNWGSPEKAANATSVINAGRSSMFRTRQRQPTQQTPKYTDYESAGLCGPHGMRHLDY